MRWTEGLREAIHQEVVALDGKALRRAKDAGEEIRYIVSARAQSNRLVLGQIKVTGKSNQITAVPLLLRALELAGCIVTTDAMDCRKKVAKEIIEADADMEPWEGLRSAGMVESTRIIGDKETMERRYFLSSPELEPKTLPCRMVPRVSVWCS